MLGRLLAVVLGLGGVVAGSQAPNFTAHFMQNLEGRVDELGLLAADITSDRERLNYTRKMAQAACAAAEAEVVREDCNRAEETLDRFGALKTLQDELKAVTGWERPLTLAKAVAADDMVRGFAENVKKEFEPAIPATAEGAGYAAGTGGGIWVIFRILFGLIGAPFRRN